MEVTNEVFSLHIVVDMKWLILATNNTVAFSTKTEALEADHTTKPHNRSYF